MRLGRDDNLLAAEFAPGARDPGERATLAAPRRRDAAAPGVGQPRAFCLDAANVGWRRRRAALSEATQPREPRLAVQLRGGRAAAMAGFVARALTRAAARREFVAMRQETPDAPAFAVSVNVDTREFTLRPVAAATRASRLHAGKPLRPPVFAGKLIPVGP